MALSGRLALGLAVALVACARARPIGVTDLGPDLAAFDVGGPDLATVGAADLASPPDLAGSAAAAACAAALAPFHYDFEAGPAGFTHEAMDGFSGDPSWPFDEWDQGSVSGPGPGACHGGSGCFATYRLGNYVSCERGALRSPTLDLSACSTVPTKVSFFHYYDFWAGITSAGTWYDGGLVELSGDGGATWQAAALTYPGTLAINPQMTASYMCLAPNAFYAHAKPGFVQTSGGAWQKVDVPIPAALRTAKFAIRFVYATGVSSQNNTPATSRPNAKPGWYLDDLSLLVQ
jgi:hypothetical protein